MQFWCRGFQFPVKGFLSSLEIEMHGAWNPPVAQINHLRTLLFGWIHRILGESINSPKAILCRIPKSGKFTDAKEIFENSENSKSHLGLFMHLDYEIPRGQPSIRCQNFPTLWILQKAQAPMMRLYDRRIPWYRGKKNWWGDWMDRAF